MCGGKNLLSKTTLNFWSAGQSSDGLKNKCLSFAHIHLPGSEGSSRTPCSAVLSLSSRRAAESLNRISSVGNVKSFSNFVTGTCSIITLTKRGFGRCLYQCSVHTVPHESRMTAIIPEAVMRGCARLKPEKAAWLFESHRGGLHCKRPKTARAILFRRVKRSAKGRAASRSSRVRSVLVFIKRIRDFSGNLSGNR